MGSAALISASSAAIVAAATGVVAVENSSGVTGLPLARLVSTGVSPSGHQCVTGTIDLGTSLDARSAVQPLLGAGAGGCWGTPRSRRPPPRQVAEVEALPYGVDLRAPLLPVTGSCLIRPSLSEAASRRRIGGDRRPVYVAGLPDLGVRGADNPQTQPLSGSLAGRGGRR